MRKLLAIMVLGLLFGGCAGVEMKHTHYFRVQDAVTNYHNIAPSINLGDSKTQVLNKLLPLHAGIDTDWLKQPVQFSRNGSNVYVHFHKSAHVADGYTTDDEFTPYIFAGDRLIEIGWVSLQRNTFAQQGNVYTGLDAFRDSIGAIIDADNSRRGVSSSSNTSNSSQGFLKRETTDGLIKICYYKGVRGTYTLNIKTVELCPLRY
jgi:hypothetical protein